MFRRTPLLLAVLFLVSPVQARPSPPGPAGPPPPARKAPRLAFEDALTYAQRAAVVTRQLRPGELTLKPTPQGARLNLGLTYLGRQVTSVTLGPQLQVARRADVPLLPEVRMVPTLDAPARDALADQVQRLAAAGLGQVAGPKVRVPLLSGGAVVAELHFDAKTGVLLADPPGTNPPKVPKH